MPWPATLAQDHSHSQSGGQRNSILLEQLNSLDWSEESSASETLGTPFSHSLLGYYSPSLSFPCSGQWPILIQKSLYSQAWKRKRGLIPRGAAGPAHRNTRDRCRKELWGAWAGARFSGGDAACSAHIRCSYPGSGLSWEPGKWEARRFRCFLLHCPVLKKKLLHMGLERRPRSCHGLIASSH